MVHPPSHHIGFGGPPETFRDFEISRFRKWYIETNTFGPPPGFENINGHWPRKPPLPQEVNEAVKRFLDNGYRYPHYPFSNW